MLQLSGLLREAFDGADARESFVETLIRFLPERNFEAYEAELKGLDPDALHRFALTGQAPFPVTATPLPNLLFTRDLSAVVGDHAILSQAATAAAAARERDHADDLPAPPAVRRPRRGA